MFDRLWPYLLNIGSMAWAIVHCSICAFGTQDQRSVAAFAGIFGAYAILRMIWRTSTRIAELETRLRLMQEIEAIIDPELVSESPASSQGTAIQTAPAPRQ